MAALLSRLRHERHISQRQLADAAGLSPSVVHRAESGKDARLSTWERLFAGIGYFLDWKVVELAEEMGDLLNEERARRQERQYEGLCAGKRRFY